MEQEEFLWDYREEILRYLTPEMKILDIGTGGGEFLRALNHPCENTAATENYPPNVVLCREVLIPLGVDFRPGSGETLSFEDGSFDMVINRNGDFCAGKIYQVLKPGGLFITQQVGAENFGRTGVRRRQHPPLFAGDAEIRRSYDGNQWMSRRKTYPSLVGSKVSPMRTVGGCICPYGWPTRSDGDTGSG